MPTTGPSPSSLAAVARELARIETSCVVLEQEMRAAIARVAPERRESAKNLVHYVALRQHDLQELQTQLSQAGLSSLGRSESCVMRSLVEVSERVNESLVLGGHNEAPAFELDRLDKLRASMLSWEAAREALQQATRAVLGPRPKDRNISIMVTAPSAKEADRAWMVKLLKAGMNVLRVNCAHETEKEWGLVVTALAEARQATGRDCKVAMDLAGPKIRTGPIAGARHIATWKPIRDDIGRPIAPARVVLHRASAGPIDTEGAVLFIDDQAFDKVHAGDELRFKDARDKRCSLQIHEAGPDALVAFSTKRTYLLDGVRARLFREGEKKSDVPIVVGGVHGAAIDIKAGDPLELTVRAVEGHPPQRDAQGAVTKAGLISCTLPAALDHLEQGHRVLFDDGKIHAIVERGRNSKGDFLLRVVRAQKQITKLRAEKGINLPDTTIKVPSLTDEDRQALAFVARHADAVSLSFVRGPEDVRLLSAALDQLGRPDLAVVLKIETRLGFENLPKLLLEGLSRPGLAVMIARGDLAVEVGFERLAEVQEEILWLCEASHVPAIWATQVLDTLARTGVPSRAEVTDAAASVAADCVMLNKGPFVDEAVAALSNILRRMETHHDKKRALFRKLKVSTFAER